MAKYRLTYESEKVDYQYVEAENEESIPRSLDRRLGNGYYITSILEIAQMSDVGVYRVTYEATRTEYQNVEATSRENAIEALGDVLPDGRHVSKILEVKELSTKDKDINYLNEVEGEEDEEVEEMKDLMQVEDE